VASLYKIFHPEIFQGSLNGKNYFEGWYFKHVSENADDAFAVIPGISLSDDTHAFIMKAEPEEVPISDMTCQNFRSTEKN
jgi:hypothetical protein